MWKAAVTVHFLKAAAERGLVFDADDLAAAATSIRCGVLRPGGELGAGFESGTPALVDFPGEVFGGFGAYLTLLELAGADPGIRTDVGALANRPESGGWLAGRRASIGYAWRLLLESGLEPTVLG